MVAVDGVAGIGPTHTAIIALTRVILMARPMAATTATATAMLDLTGAATAGVVVGVVGDAIDGILRGVALVTFQAGDPEPSAAISNSSPEK